MRDDNRKTKDKIKLNSKIGKLICFLKDDTQLFKDNQFFRWAVLQRDIINEGINQVKKWGVQRHTLSEWLMYTTEELGELAKAISEYVYRNGTVSEIYREAIQTATLALKIAEMVFTDG